MKSLIQKLEGLPLSSSLEFVKSEMKKEGVQCTIRTEIFPDKNCQCSIVSFSTSDTTIEVWSETYHRVTLVCNSVAHKYRGMLLNYTGNLSTFTSRFDNEKKV